MVFVYFIFFWRFYTDIWRKNYLLEQLGQILSPSILKNLVEGRALPTIDIISPKSLHGWMNLRRVVSGYGLKYLRRHELFMPTIIFVMFMSTMIVVDIFYFNTIFALKPDMDDFYNPKGLENLKLCIFCAINWLVLFIMLFYLLYTAAGINSYFEIHNHIIKKNKMFFEDIKTHRESYFKYDIATRKKPNSRLHLLIVHDLL